MLEQMRALKAAGKDVSKDFEEMRKHLTVVSAMKVMLELTGFKEAEAQAKELKQLIGDITQAPEVWNQSLEEGIKLLEEQKQKWSEIQDLFEKARMGDTTGLKAKLVGEDLALVKELVPTEQFEQAKKDFDSWLNYVITSAPQTFDFMSKQVANTLKSIGINIYELIKNSLRNKRRGWKRHI